MIAHKERYLRGRDHRGARGAAARRRRAGRGRPTSPAYPTEVAGLAGAGRPGRPGRRRRPDVPRRTARTSTTGSPGRAATADTPERCAAKVRLVGCSRPGSGSARSGPRALADRGRRVAVARRRRPARPPGPATDQDSSSASTPACLSTQSTTRSPLLARLIACRVASISSSTTSTCLHRAPRPCGPDPWPPARRLAALAAAQGGVLAHDDHVEVLGGDRARARACPRRAGRRPWRSRRCATAGQVVDRVTVADLVDEVAEHPHAGALWQ